MLLCVSKNVETAPLAANFEARSCRQPVGSPPVAALTITRAKFMSSTRHLETELALLANECKRRNADIRQLCEKAQLILKNHPPEASITALDEGLRRQLAAPLVATLSSSNPKLVTIAILALNRLAAIAAFTNDTLPLLLDGFLEASHMATDIQLRILQCLPQVMQNYISLVRGQLLAKILEICTGLTAANKPAVVINTASATLQQLFGYIYERNEKYAAPLLAELSDQFPHKVAVGDDTVFCDDLSYEGYVIFQDLCNVLNHSATSLLGDKIPLRQLDALELIHTIVSNHQKLFTSRQEVAFLIKEHLVPSLLHILNTPDKPFPLFVRCLRIVQCLLMYYVDVLEIESELLLSYLNHLLLNDENVPQEWSSKSFLWEKILVLETFLGIFNSFPSVLSIYRKFDTNPQKKNVLLEILNTLRVFIHHNAFLVTETLETIGSSHPTSDYISKKTSTLRVTMLDNLDKSDPPSSIPQTYPVYLLFSITIAYLRGVVEYISKLSNDANDTDLEFITSFIKDGHKYTNDILNTLIYTKMDNEAFHQLIRAIQKYIHSTGLLGLAAERDHSLQMLSHAILENVSSHSESKSHTHSASASLLDKGTQLLNYGESLVESFTSTLVNNGTEEVKEKKVRHSRRFNSRQVVCLRALYNLAISLGSTLNDSWDIIYITFQWCDYYIHGTDELSLNIRTDSGNPRGNIQRLEDMPRLTTQDIGTIDSLKVKLLSSFSDYPSESFANIINSLVRLSEILFGRSEVKPDKKDFEKTNGICPYNRLFFFNQIEAICKASAPRFVTNSVDSWTTVSGYITQLGRDRSYNYNLRIHIVEALNSIIGSIAEGGFSIQDKEVSNRTADLTLNCLSDFLDSIFTAGNANEQLVINCETEIHLKVLTTVHELIDKYDLYYQSSWKQVFSIINTPFVSAAATDITDSNLREKKAQLVNYAFETLKLILDEFLESLPSNQLKMVINTLFNFSEQQYDLNISFSSVSCFWQIGDAIKAKIESSSTDGSDKGIASEEELSEYLSKDNGASKQYFIKLDAYLLLVLAKACSDNRARVRDGAIQTFFQIVDVHGLNNLDWNLIFKIALPHLLNVKIDPLDSNFNKSEWLESLSLTFTGFENVYNKFITTSTEHELYWESILDYLTNLLKHRWVDLDLKIIKCYDELLSLLLKKQDILLKLKSLFYHFWTSVSIEYDFINPMYQDFLTSFSESYINLNKLIEDDLDEEKVLKIIHALSHCARYPVLPNNAKDETKPSKLQNAVLNNLKCMTSEAPVVQSAVVQQLANMVVFPFGVKSRIEQRVAGKLNGTANLPTFCALSKGSMDLLNKKLKEISDLNNLVRDGALLRVLKSLIEIIKHKPLFTNLENSGPIWIDAELLARELIQRLMADEGSMIDKSEWAEVYWQTILQVLLVCFDVGDLRYEKNVIEQYGHLNESVFPVLLKKKGLDNLVDNFLKEVFHKSFLYLMNDIEEEFTPKSENTSEWVGTLTEILCNYNFNASIGTTMDLQPYADSQIRLTCLAELCKFAAQNYSSAKQMLICRAAFCLRRFVADERLLYRAPLPRIQQKELFIVLDALASVLQKHNQASFEPLKTLLVEAIPYASRIDGLAILLQQVLQQLAVK